MHIELIPIKDSKLKAVVTFNESKIVLGKIGISASPKTQALFIRDMETYAKNLLGISVVSAPPINEPEVKTITENELNPILIDSSNGSSILNIRTGIKKSDNSLNKTTFTNAPLNTTELDTSLLPDRASIELAEKYDKYFNKGYFKHIRTLVHQHRAKIVFDLLGEGEKITKHNVGISTDPNLIAIQVKEILHQCLSSFNLLGSEHQELNKYLSKYMDQIVQLVLDNRYFTMIPLKVWQINVPDITYKEFYADGHYPYLVLYNKGKKLHVRFRYGKYDINTTINKDLLSVNVKNSVSRIFDAAFDTNMVPEMELTCTYLENKIKKVMGW
jgi:hypothetical protein